LTAGIFGEKLMGDKIPVEAKHAFFASFEKELEQKDMESVKKAFLH
jgi:hypothetical protein